MTVTAGVNAKNHTVSFRIANEFLETGKFSFDIKSINDNQAQAEFEIKVNDAIVARYTSKAFPKDKITVHHTRPENNFFVVKLEHTKDIALENYFI